MGFLPKQPVLKIPGVAIASDRNAHEMGFPVPDRGFAGVPVELRRRGFGNRFPLGASPRESGHGGPGDRFAREGYAWRTYGENIAVGYPTVSAVMQGWLGSDGHCRNIMNPAFREIGAAYAEGPYLGNPSAPYWTFDLAAPR